MPDFCTCGAELPPNARFCHMCGKPQRDEPLIPVEEIPAPITPPPVAVRSLGFHKRIAVRLGMLSGLIANVLIVAFFIGFPVWLVAAGFLCVSWYRRRTGERVTIPTGIRIGWITGLFSFGIFAVLSTASFVAAVRTGAFEQMLRENSMPALVSPDQILKALESPATLAVAVGLGLTMMFVVFTILSVAGGALGAKLVGGGN